MWVGMGAEVSARLPDLGGAAARASSGVAVWPAGSIHPRLPQHPSRPPGPPTGKRAPAATKQGRVERKMNEPKGGSLLVSGCAVRGAGPQRK